jgi:hypothetical protein
MSAPVETHPISQQLQQLADKIRLQIHLGSMNAKDAWARLEPRVHEYERKAAAATDKLADEAIKLGRKLETELTKLLDDLKKD